DLGSSSAGALSRAALKPASIGRLRVSKEKEKVLSHFAREGFNPPASVTRSADGVFDEGPNQATGSLRYTMSPSAAEARAKFAFAARVSPLEASRVRQSRSANQSVASIAASPT